MKKAFLLSISIFFIITLFSGISLGIIYMLGGNTDDEPELNMLSAEIGPMPFEATQERRRYMPVSTEVPEPPTAEDRIGVQTKMIYEYYYEVDKKTVTSEEEPMYHLLRLTSGELADLYNGWELVSFSEEEVTLRKTIENPDEQSYIVGVLDGYITVFYEDGTRVKEVTNTPITALPKDDQYKLINGIIANNDKELVSILQDYGS